MQARVVVGELHVAWLKVELEAVGVHRAVLPLLGGKNPVDLLNNVAEQVIAA